MIPIVKTRIPEPEKLMPALQDIIYSGYVAQGKAVDEFESKFEGYIGGGHSISVNSGTAALHIALLLAGVEPGDEVISTAMTAEPTNVAIKMVGAKIRYADVDPKTANICPSSIAQNINVKTKAIMVVDYAGIPVDVAGIKAISEKHNIPVIHDAAHAVGSKFNGLMSGHHFPYTCYSFQAIKHFTTIDGGMLHVLDQEDYERGKLIRWFGIDKTKTRMENNIQLQGFKYHMNNVNATIGLVQLEEIDSIVNAHIENGQFLDESLKDVPGIELMEYYPNSEPSFWLYTAKVENRDGFVKKLNEHGVMASELHKRNDTHDFLNDFDQTLPVLDDFYPKLVHLPCGWWVGEAEREQIVNAIKGGW